MQSPLPSSGSDDEDFKPLTREQARRWRQEHPQVAPSAVLRGQAVVVSLAALLLGVASRDWRWAAECWYGSLAICLPSALMLWALTRRSRRVLGRPQAALADFFLWEGVKLVLAIAMMAATPVWFDSPSWLALTAGVLLALKAHWLVAWRLTVQAGRKKVH